MTTPLTPEDRRTRAAIALCFMQPGALFGLVTARLPALSVQANFDTADIALLLFFSGFIGFLSLFMAAPIMRRFGSIPTLRISIPCAFFALVVFGFSTAHWIIYAAIIVVAFTLSLIDVSANAQGMRFETKTGRPTMSLFHGFYGLGVILAGASSSLFAHWHIGPGPNFAVCMSVIAILAFCYVDALLEDERTISETTATAANTANASKASMGLIYLLGTMALLMYAAEGVVSDWGSLFMVTIKGSEESIAAMSYGVFCAVSVTLRFWGDRLRIRLGNLRILFWSAFIAALGMTVVFATSSSFATLVGFAITGLGLSLTVPIAFSIAGQIPGVDPETASTRVSICAYSGLFLFPPIIGMVAKYQGLEIALYSIYPILLLFFLQCLWLRRRVHS